MTKTITGISLDVNLLASLDVKRGLIPRSRFIEKIIQDSMEIQT